jgi:hypothetical protein
LFRQGSLGATSVDHHVCQDQPMLVRVNVRTQAVFAN